MLVLVVGQTAVLDVVHTTTLVPSASAVTVALGLLPEIKLPPPAGTILHCPVVPPVGVLADNASVGVLKHKVWEVVLITAGLGGGCTTKVMLVLVVGQTAVLDVVHTMTLVPCANAVTVALGLLAEIKLPLPVNMLHWPVVAPVGVLADKARVGVLKHNV